MPEHLLPTSFESDIIDEKVIESQYGLPRKTMQKRRWHTCPQRISKLTTVFVFAPRVFGMAEGHRVVVRR